MTQQQLNFDANVRDGIESLLARCDRIHRGSEISRPHVFDDAGQRHAASVAAKDRD